MGKSPGKWLKTLLLGKKASRSKMSKERDSVKSVNEKEALDSAKAPTADSIVSPPLFSHPAAGTTDRNGRTSQLENGVASNLSHDVVAIGPGNRDPDMQGTTLAVAPNDPEKIKQEQAATKAQAAFRGYLARRAFRALRGIIRLQALVRGHLVRRQAAATLRCMQGIVKFQALVRGRRVRLSVVGIRVHEKCFLGKEDATHSNSSGLNASNTRREKLWANAFIRKHFASSPNVMPLRLQYDMVEPNSAWTWLELWTISRMWEPLPRPKKVDLKSQPRPKRSVRRVPAANLDNGSVRSSLESEKPKRYLRKALSHPVDSAPESPQSELEKVKRNLKKVSSSAIESSDRVEAENGKLKHVPRKASGSPAADVPDLSLVEPAEKMKKDLGTVEPSEKIKKDLGTVELSEKPKKDPDTVEPSEKAEKEPVLPVSKQLDVEIPPLPLAADETVEGFHDDRPADDSSPVENSVKDDNIQVTNGGLISKDVKTGNENQKASRRRASFPAKQDYAENGSQNSPKLPSYMQATESAKAKLRAQGSPKSGPDVAEQNGLTRRHSLPSSTNGKMSSPTPRTQRLVQANGKGGIKSDRSLLSSRDGNEKVVQAEWRR